MYKICVNYQTIYLNYEILNCCKMKTINYLPNLTKTKYTIFLTILLACFTFLMACSGDDDPALEGNNISMADLAGT